MGQLYFAVRGEPIRRRDDHTIRQLHRVNDTWRITLRRHALGPVRIRTTVGQEILRADFVNRARELNALAPYEFMND